MKHFPGMSNGSLQVRHSTKLKGSTLIDESSKVANDFGSGLRKSGCSG
jgi:hypothetical protein